jgi:hypothetical protein
LSKIFYGAKTTLAAISNEVSYEREPLAKNTASLNEKETLEKKISNYE